MEKSINSVYDIIRLLKSKLVMQPVWALKPKKILKRRREVMGMAKLTFRGGIHPYDGKNLSKDKPMKTIVPKGDMVYPLSQHIGAPATPIVAKGDRVLTGQKIAEAGGFVSAPIYSTVSGITTDSKPVLAKASLPILVTSFSKVYLVKVSFL